jgi:hypothetical protein
MKFSAYTDYPFKEFGDLPNQEAPIRELLVIGYDRNKYCQVQIKDPKTNKFITTEIKAGYLYSVPGRLDEVPIISNAKLYSLPDF